MLTINWSVDRTGKTFSLSVSVIEIYLIHNISAPDIVFSSYHNISPPNCAIILHFALNTFRLVPGSWELYLINKNIVYQEPWSSAVHSHNEAAGKKIKDKLLNIMIRVRRLNQISCTVKINVQLIGWFVIVSMVQVGVVYGSDSVCMRSFRLSNSWQELLKSCKVLSVREIFIWVSGVFY